jgi:hypothetical protein
MAKDKNAKLRDLIAGYSDSIRLSDIKALIAVLFVAIMMGTVLQFRELYPWYLSAPVILTPFMIVFLNLLISVYPRFPRAGRQRFPIWRNPDPEDFDFIADNEAELEGLPAMRDSVPYPLVEEHHAADGRCSVDGLPRGGRDTAVRRTALSAPPARLTPVHASSIGCPEYVDTGCSIPCDERPLRVENRSSRLGFDLRATAHFGEKWANCPAYVFASGGA